MTNCLAYWRSALSTAVLCQAPGAITHASLYVPFTMLAIHPPLPDFNGIFGLTASLRPTGELCLTDKSSMSPSPGYV